MPLHPSLEQVKLGVNVWNNLKAWILLPYILLVNHRCWPHLVLPYQAIAMNLFPTYFDDYYELVLQYTILPLYIMFIKKPPFIY
jgi:hypothetical protein